MRLLFCVIYIMKFSTFKVVSLFVAKLVIYHGDSKLDFGVRMIWVLILTPPLASWMALSNLLYFTPWFPHLKMGIRKSIYRKEFVHELNAKSWLIGKDPEAGRDWGQEEKGTIEEKMAGWHHSLDTHEFRWTLGVGDGQGGLEYCDSWGQK